MIPQDLLVEILLRLHVKTLARCVCISKLWASIIRSRNFINSYQSRSSTREPHVLFAFRDTMTIRWRFFTFQETPSNATRFIENTPCLKPHCVNGLVCCRDMQRLLICNPITRKIIPLPQTDPSKTFLACYLGYDHINYQYKVLSLKRADFEYDPYKVVPHQEIKVHGKRSRLIRIFKLPQLTEYASTGVCISVLTHCMDQDS